MKKFLNSILAKLGYIIIKKPNPYKSISNVFSFCNIIIDVGVADGTDDLWKLLAQDSQLILIDPFIDHYNYSPDKLNFCKNVKYFKHALSNYTGSINMTNIGRASSLNNVNSLSKNTEKISVVQFKDIINLKENLTNYPNLLKIDVEGYEFDVLAGIGENFKFIDFIIVEIGFFMHNGDHFYKIINLLKDFNFQAIEVVDWPKNPNGSNGTFDLLLVNLNSKFKNDYLNLRYTI